VPQQHRARIRDDPNRRELPMSGPTDTDAPAQDEQEIRYV
jgi:hypothetical protein